MYRKGKDYNAGGARYNTNICSVGIGTITDCLAAVKYNVYDKKNFTMDELMAALDDNFIGHERILNLVKIIVQSMEMMMSMQMRS